MSRLTLILLIMNLAACQKNPLSLGNHEDDITPRLNGKPVLTYHKAIQSPPADQPAYYKRSGFIHPLYTPEGIILTDGFPEGHMHQHGLFFAFVNTTFRGNPADFWNQQNGSGTVRFARMLGMDSSQNKVGFRTHHEHLAIHDGDTIIALDEQWDIQVHNTDDIYLIDLISRISPHHEDSIFINEYHYGGLGLRGNAEWNDLNFEQPGDVNYIGKDGKGGFLTSTGKSRIDGNHSHERWVSFHGQIGGDSAGVVVLAHPDNFRFPQAVRLHPVMPYFSISPMVDGQFILAPGDTLVSKYRIITHDGPPSTDMIEAEWNAFKNM